MDGWDIGDVSRWANAETPIQFQAGGLETGMWFETFTGVFSPISYTAGTEDAAVSYEVGINVQGDVSDMTKRLSDQAVSD